MRNDLHQEAIRIAKRPYRSIVFLDETTDGEPIYVALNPELDGCISQGNTPDEALHNLNEGRIDYIYFLLEDKLAVPDPQLLGSHTTIFVSELMQDYGESEAEVSKLDEISPDNRWIKQA